MIDEAAILERRLTLSAGEAHLWSADLTVLSDGWLELLSPDEHQRAERPADPAAARWWGRGRGLLRALLGAYLDADPRTLCFGRGPHGKPFLADPPPGAPAFNLSHSRPIVLYGFAPNGNVGVDVQLPRARIDEPALAARAFGPELAASLRRLDPARRRRAFLRAWTRHEATLKWRGAGIGTPGPDDASSPWIAELDLGDDAVAALALDREPIRLLTRAVGGQPPTRSASARPSPVA
jgi:4'-phosphopantetheinyl transferase